MEKLDCEIKSINHEGFKIYTKVYGENKLPIILLHGFPDNSHLYDLLVPQLTTVFQVIIPHFPDEARGRVVIGKKATHVSRIREHHSG